MKTFKDWRGNLSYSWIPCRRTYIYLLKSICTSQIQKAPNGNITLWFSFLTICEYQGKMCYNIFSFQMFVFFVSGFLFNNQKTFFRPAFQFQENYHGHIWQIKATHFSVRSLVQTDPYTSIWDETFYIHREKTTDIQFIGRFSIFPSFIFKLSRSL